MTMNGFSILAVVPARGGSKGVPLKNIHPLAGRPLISHVGDILHELDWLIDRSVVSTDHDDIARAAGSCGIDAPFRRPEPIAGDRIGDLEVLQHALNTTEEIDGGRYDIVIMLQPTSPLRRSRHIRQCLETICIEDGPDAVWTVTPTDFKYHPLKQLVISDGQMSYHDPDGDKIIARQQLGPVYHRNGACYAFTRKCLLELGTILPPRTAAVIVDEPMISIDTLEDFRAVEQVLAEREDTE